MAKTFEEINEKIKKRKAVVLTAEEMTSLVSEKGVAKAADQVDVVTTGTFGPMCSSGVFINFGHSNPRIRATKVWLNGVEAYSGIAAVDCYLGATQLQDDEFQNMEQKTGFYGGAHVIHELLSGNKVQLVATSPGTDCYPNKKVVKDINLEQCPDAILVNMRNSYQNYNVAVNFSKKKIYTYMGVLKPELGNATYCSAGQMSPLLNDPRFLTIGIGTRIFLGGGIGYIIGPGTQHRPSVQAAELGFPVHSGGTLAVSGNLKQMQAKWIRAANFPGYGVSMRVGVGVPIPILNEEMAGFTAVGDDKLVAPVVDYANDYPVGSTRILDKVSYAQLKTGFIDIDGKKIPTSPLSSYKKAIEIASELKTWIQKGEFLLSKPSETLPQ